MVKNETSPPKSEGQAVKPLREGTTVKGGKNDGARENRVRPAPPAPMGPTGPSGRPSDGKQERK